MGEIVHATLRLYQKALAATLRSFVRCWIIAVAVVIFGFLMYAAVVIAAPMGLVGGFLLGAANAFLLGATLSLVEVSVKGSRQLTFQDIWGSVGHYFWDVIGVLFMLWVPIMILEQATAATPNGQLFTSAVFLLLFILLNAAPEVIYQVSHNSPLDVLRESYEFVVDNWIEWFLPVAVVVAPLGLTFFFGLSSRVGRDVGLNFFDLLLMPGTVLAGWLSHLGVPSGLSMLLVIVLTPPLAVLMLMFRGHLFAALRGTSRRQRMFMARGRNDE